MCQKIPEEYKHIFVPGVNCVEFENDMSDFEEKVFKYRSDDERREIVSKALSDSVNHTWEKRAEELVNFIRGIK